MGGLWSLSDNSGLPWSEALIERYEDRWGWVELSENSGLPWSVSMLEKFEHKIVWRYLNLQDFLGKLSSTQIRQIMDAISKESNSEDQVSVKDADEKSTDECNELGGEYYWGYGVDQNDEQAVYWYRKAAVQGHALGQFNLGDMYRKGYGVEQDYEQAVYWYRKAAVQCNEYSQYELGNMYETGRGVEKDYEQAQYWYRKAAEQRDEYSET